MARNNQSTVEYLTNIKNKMKQNIMRNQSVAKSKADAQLLENFFNEIGGQPIDPDNIVEGITREDIQDAIKRLGMGKVWHFKGSEGIKDISGVGFEDYLGRLSNRIMQNAKKQGLASWSKSYNYIINLGSSTVNLYNNITDDISNETTKNLIDQAYKDVKTKLDEDNMKAQKKYGVNAKVQGKIDNAMKLLDFTVSDIDNPALKRILPLLADSSFSDKAYLTTGYVRIGQTNSFRVFLAVSGEGSAEEKIYHWERMLNCMDYHDEHNAAMLFYQIRYMYELTGYGLQYTENKINQALGNSLGAKYFIYYHPGKDNGKVRVISTAAIINDFIFAVENDGYFQTHSAKCNDEKAYALYATLKMRMNNGDFEFG